MSEKLIHQLPDTDDIDRAVAGFRNPEARSRARKMLKALRDDLDDLSERTTKREREAAHRREYGVFD